MLPDTIVDLCERLGWWVSENIETGEVEVGHTSPAGEDFFFSVNSDHFVEEVAEYARGFNPDDHAAEWIPYRGTRGVPESVRVLIDDADAILEMLKTLAKAIAG